MTDQKSNSLVRIAALPASQQAVRLLALLKAPVMNGYPLHQEPALVQLLTVAVEEGPALGVDVAVAEAVLQDLMFWGLVMGKWEAAINAILQEDQAPAELWEAQTEEQAIQGIINLANQSAQ